MQLERKPLFSNAIIQSLLHLKTVHFIFLLNVLRVLMKISNSTKYFVYTVLFIVSKYNLINKYFR